MCLFSTSHPATCGRLATISRARGPSFGIDQDQPLEITLSLMGSMFVHFLSNQFFVVRIYSLRNALDADTSERCRACARVLVTRHA